MMLANDAPPVDAERMRFRRELVIAVAAAAVGPLVTACDRAINEYLARRREAEDDRKGNV